MISTRAVNRATLRSSHRQQRRQALIISCVSLVVVMTGAATVIAIGSSQPQPQSGGTSSTSEGKLRNARIVDELSRQCQNFDNQSGWMTLAEACDVVGRDEGFPTPLGTIHRLDSISKSFSRH